MTSKRTIILPGEPVSTQHIYKYACRGRFPTMYMDKKGKNMKEAYAWTAKGEWRDAPYTGDLGVSLAFYHKTARKVDIDNFNKLVLDAMTGIVWHDDSQIVDMRLTKAIDKDFPRVELSVWIIE